MCTTGNSHAEGQCALNLISYAYSQTFNSEWLHYFVEDNLLLASQILVEIHLYEIQNTLTD